MGRRQSGCRSDNARCGRGAEDRHRTTRGRQLTDLGIYPKFGAISAAFAFLLLLDHGAVGH